MRLYRQAGWTYRVVAVAAIQAEDAEADREAKHRDTAIPLQCSGGNHGNEGEAGRGDPA